jgi:hypothetical protein
MLLKPGMRLFSAVCSAELITIRSPNHDVDLTIGGAPPIPTAESRDASLSVLPGSGGGCLLGKRYVDADDSVELLCTKAGDGVPAVGGLVMVVKESKALPASD